LNAKSMKNGLRPLVRTGRDRVADFTPTRLLLQAIPRSRRCIV
jgi:hypothetical protein